MAQKTLAQKTLAQKTLAQKTLARETPGTGSSKPRKTMPAANGIAPSLVNLTRPAPAFNKEWVENAPFYLDGILETQATLTEQEKEALHLALQG